MYQWVSGFEVKGGVKRDVIILQLKSGSLTFLVWSFWDKSKSLIHNMKYMKGMQSWRFLESFALSILLS